jgi:hypothetical protein
MSISYIGSTLSIVDAEPAEEDQSGYEALSFVEVGRVISIGELGDTSEDIAFDLLKPGRRSHVNGVKDLGEIAVICEYDRSDAGLAMLQAANNGNTTHSFRVTDTDGDDYYFQGLIANLRDSERTANTYKGFSFVVRGQTGVTKVNGT